MKCMDNQIAMKKTIEILRDASIELNEEEKQAIEIADFGLGSLFDEGLQLLVYINSERYCAKELVLFPNQTCPEHKHPSIGSEDGKEETFRCRKGLVYLYVEGDPENSIHATIPKGKEPYYTCRNEIILRPGEQYTIPPNTLHWFQAGEEGAIVSEFSSKSRDEFDVFTDPTVKRIP